MIKVYLASGWFNPAQMKQMQEIYEALQILEAGGHIELFAPYYDGIVLKKDDPNLKKKMKITWWLDIEKLKECDLVVASTQDHDVGTIFECGFASARGKTIFCYNSNPELGLNLMLAQEARAFCKSPEDLSQAIYHFIQHAREERYNYRYNLWQGDPI